MIIRKPDYYDRFHCIAGACSDSCCIGWEIDVDEERREQYRKETGEIGQRLPAGQICHRPGRRGLRLSQRQERGPDL